MLPSLAVFPHLRHFFPFIVIAALGLVSAAQAATPGDGGAALYREQVQPLLAKRCLSCHSAQSKQGGLDLSTREGLLHGGNSGPAIVAGKSATSPLYLMITRQQEPAMPYRSEPLPKEATALFASWIDAGASYGAPSGEPAGNVFAGVQQMLETKCVACHGGGKVNRAGLDLRTREALLRGGDSGPAVVPGKPRDSELWKRVSHETKPGMPYGAPKLSGEAITQIETWIEAGAPYTAPLKVDPSLVSSAEVRQKHWAFQVPTLPAVPSVKDQSWVKNPIDAFIAADHEKKGLAHVPSADKGTLLRRVSLDLTGLPPTPDELHAFLADTRPDAYERVVDRLLASPRYGERWGRHWMDIWRYSDWYGRRDGDDQRNSARNIWHWRDWIIESLNEDKGYGQMVTEMLAADELYPDDPKRLRATGFLARDYFRFNRNVWMQDVTEHAAVGFLGITMKCARCHDHKYDPISQEDYYRFRAFFERYDVRIDRVAGQPDPDKDGIARVFDAEPREATKDAPFIPAIYSDTFRFIRGDENNQDKSKPLSPGVPEALWAHDFSIKPVSLPATAYNPDARPFVGHDLIEQAKADITKAEKKLAECSQDVQKARAHLSAPVTSPSSAPVEFVSQIKPILDKNCISCHNPQNDESGLSLDSEGAIFLGGVKNGSAVARGKSAESPLVLYLRGTKKPRMPMTGPALPENQIALIARWIDQLPEDRPGTLKAAESAEAVAVKELAWRQANLPAIEARVAADQAKYAASANSKADPDHDPHVEKLATAAQNAETEANIAKAEADLLRAQLQLKDAQAMAPSKLKDKKVATAKKAAQDAATALAQAADHYTPIAKPYPSTSTGRRSALAQWIVSNQNPLTARVAVNDMWLRHFGKALVPTVVNFGQNGLPPTNQPLLDWLALEFMRQDWSMKALHRLMVTSNTYRMASSDSNLKNPNLKIDADNRFYWRMNPRRLEAESVRDSVLYLAGTLDETMSGPDIDEAKGDEVHRRSLYFRHTPDSQVQMLKLFDLADPTDCYVRSESIVPQQALALSNSSLSVESARLLASRISKGLAVPHAMAPDDSHFVESAFETILAQRPSAAELEASLQFLRETTALLANPATLKKFESDASAKIKASADPHLRAREDLVHALLNHTEFITIR